MAKSVKKILKSTKGETMLESIASMLMFTVLLLAVTSMIATSLKMTTYATNQYRLLRANVKLVELAVPTVNETGSVVFSFTGDNGITMAGADQKVSKVMMPTSTDGKMDIFAFVPYPEGYGGG